MAKPRLLLVGFGRFGRVAAGLLRPGYEIHVIERRRRPGLPPYVRRTTTAALGRYGTVVFALPADELKRYLERYGSSIRPGAFVADVCAVKEAPIRWMRNHLPRSVSFCGLHPLFGPDALAEGAVPPAVAVCGGRLTGRCRLTLLATLRSLGLKPLEVSARTHDKAMASTLFLTQWIGASLPRSARSAGRNPVENAAFLHLRVLARRAAGNPPGLLYDLRKHNRYCRPVAARLRKRLRNSLR